MKALICEDDTTCREVMLAYLDEFAECQAAENGARGVEEFHKAVSEGRPYDLVTLDIMMPEMDGHEALRKIRGIEKEHGVEPSKAAKIIMTTVLNYPSDVLSAYKTGAEGYLVKPFERDVLIAEMKKLGLID